MAHIVLGIGTSHTPLLTLEPGEWIHRAAADRANPRLNLSDGRWLNYEELLTERGPRYADDAAAEVLERKAVGCEAALDRLADTLEAARPDVVLIVGDDQGEMFAPSNQPAVALFHAETLTTSDVYGQLHLPAWMRKMAHGYLMDERRIIPGAPAFALQVLQGLVDQGVDLTSVAALPASSGAEGHPAGLGHAFGFIVKRLFRGQDLPVVPLLLNTYYPPNVPTAARCHDIGRALRRVIEADASDLRVAVIASGGLSHFVVDAELDERILGALRNGRPEVLRALTRGELHSGSSEILNWVLAAGALEGLPVTWSDYFPIYRTPAGTGVGAAFVCWGPDGSLPHG
jgi:hypothetical protein